MRWETSGRWTSDGECWTASMSEWPSDGAACSLSQILEDDVSPRFWLSPMGCRGVLRRAAKRGKELPPSLKVALEHVGAMSLQDFSWLKETWEARRHSRARSAADQDSEVGATTLTE